MSLFIREYPLTVRNNNSLFDEIENGFFNHPLISFPSLYPYYYNPAASLERQISKAFDKDLFKSVDFSPKINLSEDEKNYYIHADLPGMTKDQVKMEFSDDDRVLTISGERETIIDNSNDDKTENTETESDDKTKANVNKEAQEANKTEESKTEESKTEESKTEKTEENKKENKNSNKQENHKKFTRIECSYGKFSRSFSIPENADINNIQAKMDNGVLKVTISKIEPSKHESKHTIQIQ